MRPRGFCRLTRQIFRKAHVAQLDQTGVTLQDGTHVAARTVIWAAGNAASPLGRSLGVPLDKQGRVIVNEDLTIPGHPEIYVIGDMSHFAPGGGPPLPGLSPVAMQQGRHVAKNIKIQLAGGWPAAFEYWDKGTMATIGRHRAVADAGFLRFGGFVAWLAWLFIHLIFLVSFRNKLFVLISWGYAYFTYGRGARLITGREWSKSASPTAAAPAAPSLPAIVNATVVPGTKEVTVIKPTRQRSVTKKPQRPARKPAPVPAKRPAPAKSRTKK